MSLFPLSHDDDHDDHDDDDVDHGDDDDYYDDHDDDDYYNDHGGQIRYIPDICHFLSPWTKSWAEVFSM